MISVYFAVPCFVILFTVIYTLICFQIIYPKFGPCDTVTNLVFSCIYFLTSVFAGL